MKQPLIVFASMMALLYLPACAQTSAGSVATAVESSANVSPGNASTQLHERHPRYRLRKGDAFDLDLEYSPEFNQTVSVQPDGYVTLKGVGSIFVEGQTIPELTETVKLAYLKILHEPVIAVSLRDFDKPYFIASGQVGRPGKYDLRSDITVAEAVAIAGGFTDRSKHSQVILFRPVPDGSGYDAKLLNIKKLLAERNLSEDVHVEPGDLVYVPQNSFSKFRPFLPNASMGAFATPSSF